MMVRVTLPIPERVLLRLRERSQVEGRSMNETAVEALLQGLGEEPPAPDWRILGGLAEVPPAQTYDPAQWTSLRLSDASSARDLEDALDWVRGSP